LTFLMPGASKVRLADLARLCGHGRLRQIRGLDVRPVAMRGFAKESGEDHVDGSC